MKRMQMKPRPQWCCLCGGDELKFNADIDINGDVTVIFDKPIYCMDCDREVLTTGDPEFEATEFTNKKIAELAEMMKRGNDG